MHAVTDCQYQHGTEQQSALHSACAACSRVEHGTECTEYAAGSWQQGSMCHATFTVLSGVAEELGGQPPSLDCSYFHVLQSMGS